MQAWRIAKRAHALDRQGAGAYRSGGRWNSPGVAAIYAGLTPSIAAMEKLVHTGDILPPDLVLACLDLPEDDVLYLRYDVSVLPASWDALPSSTVAATIGDAFLRAGMHLGMIVPSAVMPEALNIVINPLHPAVSGVTINVMRPFEFDSRLWG